MRKRRNRAGDGDLMLRIRMAASAANRKIKRNFISFPEGIDTQFVPLPTLPLAPLRLTPLIFSSCARLSPYGFLERLT